MRLLRYFLITLAAISINACGFNKPQSASALRHEIADRHDAELAVLFIGNSYSFGVPKAFAKLAAQRGKRVHVDQETFSGWTLARHAANDATLAKIRSQRWDVVVLQEHSLIPAQPIRRAVTMFPGVKKLAAEVRKQGAIPVLYQTWGRRDDFPAMNGRVREGCRLAAEHAGGLAIVPVGDAWEREFNAGRGALLFMPDGSHPTRRGNEVSAEVFCEAFFGSATGSE
jgi:hypothetical protein